MPQHNFDTVTTQIVSAETLRGNRWVVGAIGMEHRSAPLRNGPTATQTTTANAPQCLSARHLGGTP